MLSLISAKFLIGKLPSRCQDQGLRVTLRVVDALQRSNDLVTGEMYSMSIVWKIKRWYISIYIVYLLYR